MTRPPASLYRYTPGARGSCATFSRSSMEGEGYLYYTGGVPGEVTRRRVAKWIARPAAAAIAVSRTSRRVLVESSQIHRRIAATAIAVPAGKVNRAGGASGLRRMIGSVAAVAA